MAERQETYSVVGKAFSCMEACSCLLLHYEMSVMQVCIAFQVCIIDIFTQHFLLVFFNFYSVDFKLRFQNYSSQKTLFTVNYYYFWYCWYYYYYYYY